MENTSFPEAYWCLEPIDFNCQDGWVQGHASFRPGHGVEVDLPLGLLLEHESKDGLVFHGIAPLTVDHIYGYNQRGFYQVVSHVVETHRSATYPGLKRETLHGQEMIVSKEAVNPNPLVSSVTFGIEGLREWVGIVPTRGKVKHNANGSIDELEFRYISDDVPEVVLHDADGVKVTVDYCWTCKGGQIPLFERGFVSDYKATVSFSEPLPLASALGQWVYPLWDFLRFCMGFHGSLTKVELVTADGVRADYYAAFAESKSPSQSELKSIPLGWRTHSDHLDRMFSRWLGLKGYEKEAATRAVSMLYGWELPLELSFICVAQAFEAISRVGVDQNDLDPIEFERRRQVTLSSITDKETHDWIKQKLKYCNNKSAHKLAQQELSKLGVYADYIVPDHNRFLRDHRDTRNYNTHLNDAGKPNILHDRGLVANRDATFMLLYGAVCMSLGLEPEEILRAIKASNFKSDFVYRAREFYS